MSLVLGVLIGALSVLGWHKYHGGKPKDNSNKESRLGEGDAPDLFTSIDRNPSYQHIQARSGEQSHNEIPLVHTLQQQNCMKIRVFKRHNYLLHCYTHHKW